MGQWVVAAGSVLAGGASAFAAAPGTSSAGGPAHGPGCVPPTATAPSMGGGPGAGHRPGGPGLAPGGLPLLAPAVVLAAATGYLGMPAAQVTADLEAGQTLDDAANRVSGKNPGGLQAALLVQIEARLGQAVTAGTLTGAREEQLIAGVQHALAQWMARAGGPVGG